MEQSRIAEGWLHPIDFDSLYHPCLTMPQTTTCGTVGYTAPYAWNSDVLDAKMTWAPCADRYALALLNTEFLVLQDNAPLSAEGGIFNQDELRSRSGKSIKLAQDILSSDYPQARPLFETAIQSSSFHDCPSPQDWLNFCGSTQVKPPRLVEMEEIQNDHFEQVLKKQRPAAPLWPAPPLNEMPSFEQEVPKVTVAVVTIPPDPWETAK